MATARVTKQVEPAAPDRTPRASAQAPSRRWSNRATASWLQAKLRIGSPGDRYEQEADRVADIVMRSPDPALSVEGAVDAPVVQRCACQGTCASCAEPDDEGRLIQRAAISPVAPGSIQREATESCAVSEEPKEEWEEDDEAEEKEESEDAADTTISRKEHAAAAAPPDDLEARIDASRGRGAPLPRGTREFMESRFGRDFSAVRIHTGDSAHRLNREVNSLAFTTGTDIYFGSGQFRPHSGAGRHLLAHELTHVVQQAGGADGSAMVREKSASGTIARKSDHERKFYYGHRVSGTAVHHILERLLRDADPKKDLVTEAAIPGADRFSPALNKIGVADLYKSDPATTVSGVKGIREVDDEKDVIGMNNPSAVGTRPKVVSSPTRPARVKGVRGWTGDFPAKISLGEIKPASTTKAGAGIAQLDSYERGYKAFVDRVHTLSGGKTRASLAVSRLKLTLPDRINFDKWSSQHATGSKDTTFGTRRLWVADIGGGLYLYTDFASGLRGTPPEWFSEHLRQMRELKDDIKAKHPRTGKMVSGKFLPGGPRVSVTPLPSAPPRRLQRHTKKRPANYWPDRGRKWETTRSTWGKGFRQALKTRFKSYREKVRFEKKLSKTGRTASAIEKNAVRDYKQLMFWSGRAGKFFGKVRFLLGGAWDKALGVFERMKEKMVGIRNKVKGVAEGGIIKFGWAKRLIKVIVAAAKIAVGRFITESFNFFAQCFHAAMDKVVAKLQGEITERLGGEICQARKLFEDSKARLEKDWGESITRLKELLDAIQDAKRWLDIATGLITLIRVGVQVVSCLTPPALGCLWGLVAQLGISAAVDLLVGTAWFNEKIVTPTVRDLVRKYGSPHYQSLINRVLGDGLKEYHCHIADSAFPSLDFTAKEGLRGSAARAHRDAWETEHEAELLRDLQAVFGKGKGRKVTKEEFVKLAKLIQDSKRSPAELKAMLEHARTPLSGKIDVDKAKANVKKGEVPKADAKERTIDYDKATRSNRKLQKVLGWDPLTFYKKPGVEADSEEFANAVYDLQEAMRMKKVDGILGEETLIAFYDRNKLKKDQSYRDALRARKDRKAAREKAAEERAAKEKAAKEGAGKGGKGGHGSAKAPAAAFTLLQAHEHIILDEHKSENTPSSVRIYLHDPAYRELVTKPTPEDRALTKSPKFVTLDIYVDKKHTYRMQNVSVAETYLLRNVLVSGGVSGIWSLNLRLEDGIQLTIKGEDLVRRVLRWSADS